MPAVEKLCCVCGDDVASKKRVKDQKGQYYCQPCYDARKAAAKVTAPEAVTATIASAPSSASQDGGDGELDLAPERKPAHTEVAMLGCSKCKKLVPERSVRNIDGDFICHSCFSQSKPPAPSPKMKAAVARSKAHEEEATEHAEGFKDSLLGGLVISGALIAGYFVLMLALCYFLPASKEGGMLYAIVTSIVETLFLVIRAFALIGSMVVAAHMLGGISFGYLGSAIYKSLGLFAVFTIMDFFIARNESLLFLGMGFRGILLILGFIILFGIDYFEAMVLSIVNFFVGMGLTIAMVAVTAVLMGMVAGSSSHDDEFDDGPGFGRRAPAQVAPAAPAEAAPAPAPAPADNPG